MSLSEMHVALDVLRDRLLSLEGIDGAFVRYVLALELRAAMYVVGRVSDSNDFDYEHWVVERSGVPRVGTSFLAAMAWYFVWIKRYIRNYLKLSSPTFFNSALYPGRVFKMFPAPAARFEEARARVSKSLEHYVRSLNT